VLTTRSRTTEAGAARRGQLIRTFEGHSDQVYSVAFSPDGTRVLSGNSDNKHAHPNTATIQRCPPVSSMSAMYRMQNSRQGRRPYAGAPVRVLGVLVPILYLNQDFINLAAIRREL
jgi:WD40 repeat protein